jgi:hypothetical protein
MMPSTPSNTISLTLTHQRARLYVLSEKGGLWRGFFVKRYDDKGFDTTQ